MKTIIAILISLLVISCGTKEDKLEVALLKEQIVKYQTELSELNAKKLEEDQMFKQAEFTDLIDACDSVSALLWGGYHPESAEEWFSKRIETLSDVLTIKWVHSDEPLEFYKEKEKEKAKRKAINDQSAPSIVAPSVVIKSIADLDNIQTLRGLAYTRYIDKCGLFNRYNSLKFDIEDKSSILKLLKDSLKAIR